METTRTTMSGTHGPRSLTVKEGRHERAFCMGCGSRNGVLDDECWRCGGPKKWVYPSDMTREEIESGIKRYNQSREVR